MKKIMLLTGLLATLLCAAQSGQFYVAAKSGLSIRETPSVSAKLLDKIPYGTKINLQNTGDELVTVVTEGMTGYWQRVTYNNKIGYIVDSYLLPVPPPKLAVVKEMKDYFKQVYIPFGNKLLVKEGQRLTIEEGGYEIQKQLYKNGAEWHQFLGYEYGSATWFLPDFTIQQGFLLLRLIPEFKELFGDTAVFPTESNTIKKGGREYSITVEKEQIGNDPWIKKISIEYEDGAFYEFEMYQLDSQLVIFFGSGV